MENIERQKSSFVSGLNNALRQNQDNPISIVAGNTQLYGIMKIRKSPARRALNAESYGDIVLSDNKHHDYIISLKGETAPNLSNEAIGQVARGLEHEFMQAVFERMVQNQTNVGDQVPAVYGQIPTRYKTKLMLGNRLMGGPVDYFFSGGTLNTRYNKSSNMLSLTGSLISADEFVNNHNAYLYLAPKVFDQRFDPDVKAGNIPRIFGKSPTRGESGGNVSLTFYVPPDATVIQI